MGQVTLRELFFYHQLGRAAGTRGVFPSPVGDQGSGFVLGLQGITGAHVGKW